MNTILESVLSYHGIDIYAHMEEPTVEPQTDAAEPEQALPVIEQGAAEHSSQTGQPLAEEALQGTSRTLSENNNNNNDYLPSEIQEIPELQDEDDDEITDDELEDELEEGELEEEQDGAVEKQIGEPVEKPTDNDDDVDDTNGSTSDNGNNDLSDYELLRKRNLEEQRALLRDMDQAKKAVTATVRQPKRKRKSKVKPQVTSEYGLRRHPTKNKKYT